MISPEKKMKFIQNRARGDSFNKIALAIGVSKPTLIKLAREFADEINEFEEVYIKELQECFKLSFKKQLSLIHKRLDPIQKKLDECTFYSLGAKELIDLEIKYLKLHDQFSNSYFSRRKQAKVKSEEMTEEEGNEKKSE